jgi:hypothetical protein
MTRDPVTALALERAALLSAGLEKSADRPRQGRHVAGR